jgi:hypothetical protein
MIPLATSDQFRVDAHSDAVRETGSVFATIWGEKIEKRTICMLHKLQHIMFNQNLFLCFGLLHEVKRHIEHFGADRMGMRINIVHCY